MHLPRSTLEHWAVLAAIVDEGGFGPAAHALHRSQSAVSYAMAQLQAAVGVPLLEIRGRKAALTSHGAVLLTRARGLIREMEGLEGLAAQLRQGWEAKLSLVIDVAYPRERLVQVVSALQERCPNTEVQWADAVLSGAEEAILEQSADVVVTARLPPGTLGRFLLTVPFTAVAHPRHPLFGLERSLSSDDLRRHVQIVVRDSGSLHPRDDGWLDAERRCTVTSMEASLATIRAGLGFAWLPDHLTAESLRQGALQRLPLESGGTRGVPLHLVLARGHRAGPAALTAVECFQHAQPATMAMIPLGARDGFDAGIPR